LAEKGYFGISFLKKELTKGNSIISSSLLKYGYANFSLEILEYCDPIDAIKREQYYLDLIKPEYNILKTAGSSLGFKHTLETKAKIREKSLISTYNSSEQAKYHLRGLNTNPEYKAKRLSAIQAYQSSEQAQNQLKRLNSSSEQKERLKRLHLSMKGRPKTEGSGLPSVSLEVFDTLTDKIAVYPSINEAARAIGMAPSSLNKAFKRKGVAGPSGSEGAGFTKPTVIVNKKRYHITKLS
jgi:group I intron endonuclease